MGGLMNDTFDVDNTSLSTLSGLAKRQLEIEQEIKERRAQTS